MKKWAGLKCAVAFFFAAAVFLSFWSDADGSDFSNQPLARQDGVTLAVLHPSKEAIETLRTLREKGLINIPGLSVLGVYYESQLDLYTAARDYVLTNGLQWFTFYLISAPLSAETLFRKNDCTPDFEEIFEKTDGLVFWGGADIPPSLYGEQTSLLTDIKYPYRHYLELSFAFHLLGGLQDEGFPALLEKRPGYPILGICLGCQTLNVGTGGTLVQDIWSELYGRTTQEDVIELGRECWHWSPFNKLAPQEKWADYIFHSIRLDGQGKFCTAIGSRPKDMPLILSSHHQAIDKLGKGFRPIAHSTDGKIIEAIEHTRYPNVLGVQFHPEYRLLYTSETKVKLTPQDGEPVDLPGFLKKHPPSTAFHQKLWSWVSQAWVRNHNLKKAP